jgi:hypothetical protein
MHVKYAHYDELTRRLIICIQISIHCYSDGWSARATHHSIETKSIVGDKGAPYTTHARQIRRIATPISGDQRPYRAPR